MATTTDDGATPLEYATPSHAKARPLTFPFLLAGFANIFLAVLAVQIVPTYCLSRYQTQYYVAAAVFCAFASFLCGPFRSLVLRFIIAVGAPTLLMGAWYWSLTRWAGGDDGPGLGWGLFVGGATMIHAIFHFALLVALLISVTYRARRRSMS